MSSRKLMVVTGGTRGIGFSLCSQFGAFYDIAVIYKSDLRVAEEAVKQLGERHSSMRVRAYQCDVGDYAASQNTYEKMKENFGRTADILITAAGASIPALAILQPIENFQNLMSTNYLGVVNWNKLVVGDMIKQQFGRIINITSISVNTNVQGLSAYSPTKAAVEKFSAILGGEVAKYGITVNTVRPGTVLTRMSEEWLNSFDKKSWQYKTIVAPSNRLVEVGSIGRAVQFLIESDQVNCTSITVDGGNSNFTVL